MTPDNFLTHSLSEHPQGNRITKVLSDAVAAVNPYQAVSQHMRIAKNIILSGGMEYNLSHFKRIFLVGAGKAGTPMATAVRDILGDRLTQGIVAVKDGHASKIEGVEIIEASHPLPDERGVAGTQKIIDLLNTTEENDLVICVISGGGSAILTAPLTGLGLAGLRTLTNQLLASGADIHEINTIRKHLSQIKGGQLAHLAHPAQLLTLILSDVVGDNLDIIASGPTVPDPSTCADAQAILDKYAIPSSYPFIKTPKPGNPIFEQTQNILIGTNRLAAEAGAASWGEGARVLRTDLTGEAKKASAWLAEQFKKIPRGSCWIAGGETTVTLGQNSGVGGRNQEVALAAVRALAELEDCVLVTLATDGGDGPTDAAGAVFSTKA
jgi:hydroxypyruvate reductase